MHLNSLFKHWSYRILAPGTLLREKYEALKRLLKYDISCHEQMAEFQELLYGGQYEDLASVRRRFSEFSSGVAAMIDALDTMEPGRYSALRNYHKKFDFYTRFLLAPPRIVPGSSLVVPVTDISWDDTMIGNKAKHLAIIERELGAPVPQGFAITADAFHYFIEYNVLRPAIDELLAQLDIRNQASLERISRYLQELITTAELPRISNRPLIMVAPPGIILPGRKRLRCAAVALMRTVPPLLPVNIFPAFMSSAMQSAKVTRRCWLRNIHRKRCFIESLRGWVTRRRRCPFWCRKW